MIAVPVRYHVRSLFVRKSATALTVVAIGFTVFMLILVLALAKGFELSLVNAGQVDNVMFLRNAAVSEGVSVISREQARLLVGRPEAAQTPPVRGRWRRRSSPPASTSRR